MDILFLYIEDGGRKYDKKRTFKFKEKHRKNDFIICNNCRYYHSDPETCPQEKKEKNIIKRY